MWSTIKRKRRGFERDSEMGVSRREDDIRKEGGRLSKSKKAV